VKRLGQGGSELDGPGSVAVVALDEGQGLKKTSGFIVYFWYSLPLLLVDVYVSSDHNMPCFLHLYSVDSSG
jgi:hypothetical protein